MTIIGRYQTFHSSYNDPFKFVKCLIYRCGEQLQLYNVGNKHRGMKQRCNTPESRNTENAEVNLFQCRTVHHKCHVSWPKIEPAPLMRKVGN